MAKKAYIGVGGKARKVKKAYVGIKQFEPRELPEGYTHVEYIESSGTQYIDSGVEGLPSIRAEVGISTKVTTSDAMFLAVRGSDSGATALGYWYSGTWYTSMSPYVGQTKSGTLLADTKYDFVVDIAEGKQSVSLNGEILVSDNSIGLKGTTDTLYIFARNNRGTASHQASAKIYYLRLYRNNTLVRDYVPCINSTGVAGLYDLVNSKFYGNAGTGTFTTGASAEFTARMIKKAYIGIGGVARPCFGGGELAYYGTITPLRKEAHRLGAVSAGNYALFGGGFDGNMYFGSIDTYDTSLTKTTSTESLTGGVVDLATTSVGNYALFGGGLGDNIPYNNVNAYDTSLTKGTATNLSEARYQLAATTVGNYALFGGGTGSSATRTVDAYNSSLQRTTPTTLAKARKHLAATTVGNYALFGGGYRTAADSAVDAYDSSLTRTIATALSQSRYDLAATTVGDYALFGGGTTGSSSGRTTVDAYDTSLTRTTITPMTLGVDNYAATTIGDFAVFSGGNASMGYSATDVYDASLTKTVSANLSSERYELAATTVGNYALFGGGADPETDTPYATVDAFVIA